MYAETIIERCHSGFNQWADTGYGSPWEFESDLIDEMGSDVELFELGVDELPEGMEDIRGNILNESGRVFGFFSQFDKSVCYAGVLEV